MFNKKIPFYYLILSTLLGVGIAYVFFIFASKPSTVTNNKPTNTSSNNCNYNISRLGGYHFISPLLFAEQECESDNLSSVKIDLMNYIEEAKKVGNISTASIYLRKYSGGDWISINSDEQYHPSSLIKVPLMIAYLRMAETNPKLLDQEIFFERHDPSLPVQAFKEEGLQPGHKYSIKTLLHYLIARSDNDASVLLFKLVDQKVYNKTFTDIDLPAPPPNFSDMRITAKDYSLFLKELYNASYLTIPASEFATSLLAESTFKDGLAKGLPSNIKIAHKFGEWGDGHTFELHESGIIYLDNNPYLITVMTRGNDFAKLSNVIGDISKLTYEKLITHS